MIVVELHKNFIRQYKKQRAIREQVDERLALFRANPFERILNNHPLSGNRKGQWTINITGDWRAVYVFKDKDTVVFMDLDTHGNLYK